MPARVLKSSQEPRRQLPGEASVSSANPKLRAAKTPSSSLAARKPGKSISRPEDSSDAKTKGSKDLSSSHVLECLASPIQCVEATIRQTLQILRTSEEELGFSDEKHVQSSAPLLKSTKSLRTSKDVAPSPSRNTEDAQDAQNAKAVHFAKQVVNATISSLNNLMTSGWSASSSLSSQMDSRHVTSFSATKTKDESLSAGPSRTKSSAPSSLSISRQNVSNIFTCFRIAIHFLYQHSTKLTELQSIIVSVLRKAVALELHDQVYTEITWLKSKIVDVEVEIPLYCMGAPNEQLSRQSALHIVELQALAASTCLARASTSSQVTEIASSLVHHPQGPYAWHQYAVNQDSNELDVKSLDRAIYLIERAIMRTLAKNKMVEKDSSSQFQCRSTSLELLLIVSDIDVDAYWDRVARVGVSHYRTTVHTEKASLQERQNAYMPIDFLFRSLVQKADQQRKRMREGQGFLQFSNHWLNLARKAGDYRAVQSVSLLVSSPSSRTTEQEASGLQLSQADADAALLQICSNITIAAMRFDSQNDSKSLLDYPSEYSHVLQSVTEDVQAAHHLLDLVSAQSFTKFLCDVRHLCRRALQCWERSDTSDSIKDLEFSLLRDGLALFQRTLESSKFLSDRHGPQAGDLFDDYIHLCRSTAKGLQMLATQTSHHRSKVILDNAFQLVSSNVKDGEMNDIRSKTVTQVPMNSICDGLRALSNSFHSIGAQYYSNKRPELAIPYMKAAAETANKALALDSVASNESNLKHLDQLSRKWEHLGVCYRLTSQAEASEQCYARCLELVPESVWNRISKRADSMPIIDVFSDSDATEPEQRSLLDIGNLVRSTIELQTFELLRYSNKQATIFDTMSNVCPDARAALIEYCLVGLDNTLHREEGPKAAAILLSEILTIYTKEKYPLRRARTLTRQIEHHILQGYPSGKSIVQQLIDEASSLLDFDHLGGERNLLTFVQQYRCMLDLLSLFHELHNEGPNVRMHVRQSNEKCIQAIQRMTGTMQEKKASNKTSFLASEHHRVLRNSTAVQQEKQTNPRTPVQRKTPTTRRTEKAKPDAKHKVNTFAPLCKSFDNLPRFMMLCDLVCEALVTFNDSVLTIRLVQALRQFSLHIPDLDSHKRFSAFLASQYVLLGQSSEARKTIEQVFQKGGEAQEDGLVSTLPKDRLLLCSVLRSQDLHSKDNICEKIDLLATATEEAKVLDAECRSNTWHAVFDRCAQLEQQASTAEARSVTQFLKGDHVEALRTAVSGVRLAMKAGLVLARLCGNRNSHVCENPFVQNGDKKESSTKSNDERQDGKEIVGPRAVMIYNTLPLANLGWRLIGTMTSLYLRTSRLYRIRGSVRDAEAFATEGIQFSLKFHAFIRTAEALTERSSIHVQMNMLQSAAGDADHVKMLLGHDDDTLVSIDSSMFCGDAFLRSKNYEQASNSYQRAHQLLDTLEASLCDENTRSISLEKGKKVSSNPNKSVKQVSQSLVKQSTKTLPSARIKVLQREALLSYLLGDYEKCRQVLKVSSSISCAGYSDAEKRILQGKLEMQQAWSYLGSDRILVLLFDTPVFVSISTLLNDFETKRHSMKPQNGLVEKSRHHLTQALDLLKYTTDPFHKACVDSIALRNALGTTAISQIFASSLLATNDDTLPRQIVRNVDRSTAITLDREFAEAIVCKMEKVDAQKTKPRASQRMTQPLVTHPRPSAKLLDSDEDSSDDEDSQSSSRRDLQQWIDAKNRRQSSATELMSLPRDWIVVTMAFSQERNSMIITRRSAKSSEAKPVVCSIPLDRQSRREGEEDSLKVEDVIEELNEIIKESNEATHSAQHLDGLQARKKWWTRRRELDSQLKNLLGSIEETWLGFFKGLLLPNSDASVKRLANLQRSVDEIIRNACQPVASTQKVPWLPVDEAIIDCMAALDPETCSDEDLEDLLHFVMDTNQMSGIPIAVDEVDLDVCVADLRSALESFQNCWKQETEQQNQVSMEEHDPHLFLILDKDTAIIPWESLPCLRSQAVCRIPSVSFLQDRLAMTRDGRFDLQANETNLWYLVNPSEDLYRTEERFLPHLQAKKNTRFGTRWHGVSGRAPALDEFSHALETNDLVIYFGHGGGEQFIRPSRLRSMTRCAVTMLWGCSSGVLRDAGDFERTGTPYNYMLAGCPSLVANLWDATDKELDGVSESVLTKMGVFKGSEAVIGKKKSISTAKAVALSRDACKLPFLTGAACVVYGIPVYYNQ